MLVLLLMLPAAAAPAAAMLDGVDYDLRRAPPPDSSGGDIVVTGRRVDRRVPDLPDAQETILPRAEFGLVGKARAAIHAEAHALGGGVVSNRAMVSVTVPF